MRRLITIFSMPSPDGGDCLRRQQRAIASWAELEVAVVKLVATTADYAQIKRNYCCDALVEAEGSSQGRPFVSQVLINAARMAETPLVAFINSDIILDETLDSTASLLLNAREPFLACGRRYEVDQDWTGKTSMPLSPGTDLGEKANSILRPGALSAIDVFVWRREQRFVTPRLVVGRRGWDNWLLWYAATAGWRTIDVTSTCNIYHQSHGVAGKSYLREPVSDDPRDENIRNIHNSWDLLTLRECQYVLQPNGRLKRKLLGGLLGHKRIVPIWTRTTGLVRRARTLAMGFGYGAKEKSGRSI